ncbi:MAG: phosphotransacetylase [Elusimicrobiota bacterium]|jgi:phosphate acetyltransferase|nr:phosphotransacetylase [Elusimicrobiota bacterium]
MEIVERILSLAKKSKGKVILPETYDSRALHAAQMLIKNEVADVVLPVLHGENIEALKKKAYLENIDLSGAELIDTDLSLLNNSKVEEFIESRMKKGLGRDQALALLRNPLYFSMLYLKSGKCDACVCGCVEDTADVLRAAIQAVGTAPNIKLISSYFLMVPPENHKVAKEPVLFADCSVNPNPDVLGLRDIGISTVESFNKLFPDRQANVSFLSFSTKGSAKHKVLEKIIEATKLVEEYFKDNKNVMVDGELQFDASVIPEIGKRKAPGSHVAGQANILIFPDLNAGNIGYKLAERYGGFQALGPILQGLSLPVSDLSRGCKAEDIYLTSAILLLK